MAQLSESSIASIIRLRRRLSASLKELQTLQHEVDALVNAILTELDDQQINDTLRRIKEFDAGFDTHGEAENSA